MHAAFAHAHQALAQLRSFLPPSLQPVKTEPTSWQETIYDHISTFLSERTSLENTSLLVALCTFLFLLLHNIHKMSWTSRLGNLGRFSPFSRPANGPTKVSDSDFSYITADDLRKHQEETISDQQHRSASPVDYGPQRDTDVLILRNKKREYAVHFPAYCIAKGELTVKEVRDVAASKAHTDSKRVKLFYKGKNLKEDNRTCKQEGLRDGSEILLSISEHHDDAGSSSGESGDEEVDDAQEGGGEGGRRKRRNRGNKSKRKNRREAARETGSGTSTPDRLPTNLGVPLSQASTHTGGSHTGSRAASPKPAATPATPMGKLDALTSTLASFRSDVENFIRSPPEEMSKRDFEHKKLSETILTQVLLKLDAVETEGDVDARNRRKELVKETQAVLNQLDAAKR